MKRTLRTLDIFSLASGAMISSGLFILPAVVYPTAGPGIIIAYLLAAFLVIPALFAKTELATAMPKSGGDYFFVNRSMGPLSLILTGIFVLISLVWFLIFSGVRQKKDSAIIHIEKRITAQEMQTDTLSEELRNILLERDNIIEDRFDTIIKNARIIDMDQASNMDKLFDLLATELSDLFSTEKDEIKKLIYKREVESTTVIHKGLAIPHIILGREQKFEIIVVRSKKGIVFEGSTEPVHTVFALAGSSDERNFHLQALMAIAQIVQNPSFQDNWNNAKNTNDLRHIILLGERVRKREV